MKNIFFVLLLFCIIAHSAPQNKIEDIDAITINGDITFGTKAINGWILDKNAAQGLGTCAIYYPNGETFNGSPVVVYPTTAVPDLQSDKAIESLVERSKKMFAPRAPKLKVIKQKDYKSKHDVTFQIYYFMNGPRPNNFEALAYYPYKNTVILLVYSAQTKENFDKYIKSFNEFMESVIPYSTNMNMLSGRCLYPEKNQNVNKNTGKK